MLPLNQIVEKMKSETFYFKSVYSINKASINFKNIDYGISFIYRDKDFVLIKMINESNGYILQGNFVIGKIDLKRPENYLIYDILKECDNTLDNPHTAPIKIINPNVRIFKKASFEDIFIRLRKNKINMIKTINAK